MHPISSVTSRPADPSPQKAPAGTLPRSMPAPPAGTARARPGAGARQRRGAYPAPPLPWREGTRDGYPKPGLTGQPCLRGHRQRLAKLPLRNPRQPWQPLGSASRKGQHGRACISFLLFFPRPVRPELCFSFHSPKYRLP